ncbi:hypothetical protein RB195_004472 [Necator americanus]|uniref:Uncharacterized protein n=1 Tax=Necator americanus TaxID=51031 RepID=A0ABR1BI43_NECAM
MNRCVANRAHSRRRPHSTDLTRHVRSAAKELDNSPSLCIESSLDCLLNVGTKLNLNLKNGSELTYGPTNT